MRYLSGLEIRSISINTLFQFFVRLLGSGATLIITLLIAGTLGYDSVGSFTKVTAFVSIFYLLVDFGINSIVLKTYFKNLESQIGNLFLIRLSIAILLLPLIALFAHILPQNELAGTGFSSQEKIAILIYSLTLIAVALNTTLQVFLQQKLAYKLTLLPSLLSIATLLAITLLAVSQNNFLLLFAGYIFSGSVSFIATYIAIKRSYSFSLHHSQTMLFAKKVLKASWPLGTVLFINLLYSRADIFILSIYKSNLDLGIYGVSYRFFDVLVAVPTFLANSTYPLLLQAMDSPSRYLTTFGKYLKLYGALSLLILLLTLVFSPFIRIFGESFALSIGPLQILSLSLPFFFLTSLLQWHFIIKNKIKFLVPLYVGVLVFNIILNLILVPKYSYYASALITGGSEALVFFLMLLYFLKTRKA